MIIKVCSFFICPVVSDSVNYLSTRYGVQSANTLPQIESALESIVNTTTQNEVLTNSSASINSGQGVITLVSQNNFSCLLYTSDAADE